VAASRGELHGPAAPVGLQVRQGEDPFAFRSGERLQAHPHPDDLIGEIDVLPPQPEQLARAQPAGKRSDDVGAPERHQLQRQQGVHLLEGHRPGLPPCAPRYLGQLGHVPVNQAVPLCPADRPGQDRPGPAHGVGRGPVRGHVPEHPLDLPDRQSLQLGLAQRSRDPRYPVGVALDRQR